MTNLKELRRAHGLKRSDLAEYLEMSGVTYSRYESGKYRLDQDLMVKLVQYFNVSAYYLIGITNNPV